MGRRSYTRAELRAVVIAQLRDELGASAVTDLHPQGIGLDSASVGGLRTQVAVAVDDGSWNVMDGRRNQEIASTCPTDLTVTTVHYDRTTATDAATAYDAHLTRGDKVVGRLARLVDGSGEVVPVISVRARTDQVGEGWWRTTTTSIVRTRTPTTVA